MTLCNENYKQCSCSHLKERIATLEQQVAELAAALRGLLGNTVKNSKFTDAAQTALAKVKQP